MKRLKLTLEDGNNYTFQTFNILEQRVMKKSYDNVQNLQDDIMKLQCETEDGKLKRTADGKIIPKDFVNKEDKIKIAELEDKIFGFSIDIVRKCLCKNHKEFAIPMAEGKVDEVKENEIKEKIMSLFDTPTLRKIAEFAFAGTYIDDGEDELDYTVKIEVVERKQ